MALDVSRSRAVRQKVFQVLAPSAVEQGFNASRNYFPGVQQVASTAPQLPVAQATQYAPTAAQMVRQSAGVPVANIAAQQATQAAQVAAPAMQQFALPTSSVTGIAPMSNAARGASAISSAYPRAASQTIDLSRYALPESALTTSKATGFLPFLGRASGGAGRLGAYAAGEGATMRGLLGKAVLPAAAGLGVDWGTDQLFRAFNGGENPEGRWDEMLSGAAGGATGGGIAFGPWGALAGGIGGGLLGLLQGDDSEASKRDQVAVEKARMNDEARNYMQMMGVSTGDQGKIMAQLQFQSTGLADADLPMLYNQMLPQFVDAATQISDQRSQTTLEEQSRNGRIASMQAYLLPQLNNFMDIAQTDARALDAGTGKSKYSYMQAQTNAAYLAQLAALTTMAQGPAQPTQQQPTLEDYLLAQQQGSGMSAQDQIDAIVAARQAQTQISATAKAGV